MKKLKKKLPMDGNSQKLMEIIRSEKHGLCPSKREFVNPEDWVEVTEKFGKDEFVAIQVHKETIKAFEEGEKELDKSSGCNA